MVGGLEVLQYGGEQAGWCYPSNVAAGEDVRILPRPTAAERGLPQLDYWLYDERRSAVMTYDERGDFLHVEFTEDPDTIARHIQWRDTALRAATPVHDYLPRHNLEPAYIPTRS